MTAGRSRRWGRIALVVLAVLIAGGIVAFRVAVGVLKGKVVEALGSESEIADLRVGWFSVDVEGLRIEGPRGWPAADAFRSERVAIVPSLRGVLSGELRVHSITIERPYLSALRTEDGQLQLVPSLWAGTGQPADSSPPAAAASVPIDRITLRDGVLEFFDASVTRPPLRIQLEQVQATVLDVVTPALTGKTRFDLTAVLKSVQHDGTVTIAGWAELASRDSSLTTTLRSADLLALQPYLIQAGERGVRKGTVDLDLQSEVSGRRLHAPGQLTLSGLEFESATGALGSFMGLPHDAVVGALKNRHDQISVSFTLEGDIDDPRFSLNEAFTTRLASSLAESLGVSLGGLATGVWDPWSAADLRGREGALDASEHEEHDDDDEHGSERTARAVSPAVAVRPGRQGPEEHQHEQDHDDRSEHDVYLCFSSRSLRTSRTPLTERATFVASELSADESTKPLSCTTPR